MTTTNIILVLALIVIAGIILLILLLRKHARSQDERRHLDRLAEYSQRHEAVSLEEIELSQPFMERVVKPIQNKLKKYLTMSAPQVLSEASDRMLEFPGKRNTGKARTDSSRAGGSLLKRIALQRDGVENLSRLESRGAHESETLQEAIPSLDIALKITDQPGGYLRNVNLSLAEWRLFSHIRPGISIKQIAVATGMNDQEIRKVVYSLLQAGMVDLCPQEDKPISLKMNGSLLKTIQLSDPDIQMGEMENIPGKEAETSIPNRQMQVPGAVEKVHFSVTAPPMVQPGTSFLVDAWAHLEAQRQEVIKRAKEAASGRKVFVKTRGPFLISRGTVLSMQLKISGMVIEDPEETILWEGEIGSASFAVQVPAEAEPGECRGCITVFANDTPVSRLLFELKVANYETEAIPLMLLEKRFQSAFASYASQDREAVLYCVQGMEKAAPWLNIFVDVHSLRSGQNWEQELWKHIPESDVFYLFWSVNAMRSPWVEKEWRCALETNGLEFISPVPLQSPEDAPPPTELASLHFNDWELAYRRQAKIYREWESFPIGPPGTDPQ